MSQSSSSDAADVRFALAGNREAYGRLYDRHARSVRAVVGAVSGDFSATEDLTQETFLRGYRKLSTLRDEACFAKWIQGIARVVARERRRTEGRNHVQVEFSILQEATASSEADKVALQDETAQLMSAVAELSERERHVIHAYFFHEQKAEHAAKDIGLSRSGFYAALDRAVSRLRDRLRKTSSAIPYLRGEEDE